MGFIAITKNINLKIFLLILFLSLSFFSQVGSAQTCDINITSLPYTISQNNTYYCLNQSLYIGGQTAIITSSALENTTLDCKGFNIDGNDTPTIEVTTIGIFLNGTPTFGAPWINNNTIKNCNITDFGFGIYLYGAKTADNTIVNNTLDSHVSHGIVLDGRNDAYGSKGNRIINNTIRNLGGRGIYIVFVPSAIVTDNLISNASSGVRIQASTNVTFANNNITRRLMGLGLELWENSPGNKYYIHNITTSNLIDGKPVQYFDSLYRACPNNQILNYNNTYSKIAFVTCNNVTLENTTVIDGITFASTNNSALKNSISANSSWFGVSLIYANNNTLINNTASGNSRSIYLEGSLNNTLSDNTAIENGWGITLLSSDNNTLINNTMNRNTNNGLDMSNSKNSTVVNNTIERNSNVGMYIYGSSDNSLITNNRINLNSYGIIIQSTIGVNLTQNTLSNNTYNFYIPHSAGDPKPNNSIDTTNTINGKPIYYFENIENQTYDSISVGYFACISCKNITVRNITLINNAQGLLFFYTNNSKIINVNATNNYIGIDLISSSNNTLTGNFLKWNVYGIRLTGGWNVSSNNTIINNRINLNHYGVYLFYNSYWWNTLINNTIDQNYQDLYTYLRDEYGLWIYGEATYIKNSFKDNLNTNMQTFQSTSRVTTRNSIVNFNISMLYQNGTECPSCSYDIETSPSRPITLSKTGNNITGSFKVVQTGTYTLTVNITDEDGNSAVRGYSFFVDPLKATANYYFRTIDPTNGQPAGVIAKSLLFALPTTEEIISGYNWVQASPDELPTNPIGMIQNISISTWYKGTSPSLVIERFTYLDAGGDYSQSISTADTYTFTQRNFTDLNWVMDYGWTWYKLGVKLAGTSVYLKTNSSHPSYVNISYLDEPLIKSVSNPEIKFLSAVYSPEDLSRVDISAEGQGSAAVVVTKPQNVSYNVYYDSLYCNTAICSFTQTTNEMQINLVFGSIVNIILETPRGDGSGCSLALECSGGYCVHGSCYSLSARCGDDYCDSGEYCNTCPEDCGPCPSGIVVTPGLVEAKKIIPLVSPTSPAMLIIEVDKAKELKVDQVKIEVKEAVSYAQVTVKELPSPSQAVDKDTIYKYLEITTNIPTAKIEKVKINFKVEKSWITDNSINESTIALQRYADSKWNKLTTNKVSGDVTYVYYEAESTALSVFAITGEKVVAVTEEKKPPVAEEKEAPSQEITPKIKWYLIGAVILIIIALVGNYILKKRKKIIPF